MKFRLKGSQHLVSFYVMQATSIQFLSINDVTSNGKKQESLNFAHPQVIQCEEIHRLWSRSFRSGFVVREGRRLSVCLSSVRHSIQPCIQPNSSRMDILKAEIERKKRQVEEKKVMAGPSKKYFKRSDLAAKEKEEYLSKYKIKVVEEKTFEEVKKAKDDNWSKCKSPNFRYSGKGKRKQLAHLKHLSI